MLEKSRDLFLENLKKKIEAICICLL